MSWTHEIRVGPAGWSYPDWKHIVYPAARPRHFHEAAYLAQFFDLIEINTSFYRPLRPELAHLWVRKTAHNPRFRFTAKLYRAFTHEGRLDPSDIRQYTEGLAPIHEAGRLGAVLMQFPWSFKFNRETRGHLILLKKAFPDYALVAEFRHDSWLADEAQGVLIDHHIGFCNIDQPQLNHCLPPTALLTSPVAYVRLHGRNYEQWFEHEEDHPPDPNALPHAAARYNYLYSEAELSPWADRIRQLAGQARVTYVVTNNHFEGKAVANALQLIHLLLGEPVEVPPELIHHYPEISGIARNAPAQGSLFQDPALSRTVASEQHPHAGSSPVRAAG